MIETNIYRFNNFKLLLIYSPIFISHELVLLNISKYYYSLKNSKIC